MLSYNYLLDLVLILLSTKILGIITKKFKMPQVVGALLAGLILGPSMFNILKETNFIIHLSELGVIILMFCAGLDTDLNELKKTGKASFIIAIFGVVVPLIGGFLVAYLFNDVGTITGGIKNILLQNIFIGVILTATSVSITVEALKEMGKINTSVGATILGASIIDDILGIIALTIISSMADTSVNTLFVLLKIVLYFIFVIVIGVISYKLFDIWMKHEHRDRRRFITASLVFCLLLAYISEEIFGVADITGAFIAGVILSNVERKKYVANKLDVVSYSLLSQVFFASIGLKVVIPYMSMKVVIFATILTIVAIVTKIVGAGIGAKMCKFSNKECMQIGTGMVSRGEVALIVASKGVVLGILSSSMLTTIVIVVVITTVISPILLNLAFKEKRNNINKNSDGE